MSFLRKIRDAISDLIFSLTHNEFIKILIILVTIIALSVLGIYFLETGKNDQFTTVFDTVWYTIVTLSTVGYGDKAPTTVEGRLIGILIIFGIYENAYFSRNFMR